MGQKPLLLFGVLWFRVERAGLAGEPVKAKPVKAELVNYQVNS
jgi:hypothetical protein